MATEDQTTGTTGQDGGDAAGTQTTGTPDPAGRNAESDERWKEALAWKEKAERFNDAERRAQEAEAKVSEMEARLRSTPAAQGRDDSDEDDDDRAAREWAAKNDPVARKLLKLEQRMAKREEALIEEFGTALQAIDSIEDREERKATLQHLQKQRMAGRPIDLEAAKAEIGRNKMAAEIERLRKENERLSRKPEPRNDDAPPTIAREPQSPGQPTKVQMTEARYDKEIADLLAAGKFKEVAKMQERYARDEIELT